MDRKSVREQLRSDAANQALTCCLNSLLQCHSVRKERKVRPGFTPVEDVMRYRPARVREAEEARKKGIPGSVPTQSTAAAAAAVAPSGPSASPPPSASPSEPQRSETQRTSWRSNTPQRQAALTVDPTSSPRADRLASNAANNSEASPSGERSWRNSRLRKPASSDASKKAVTSAGSSQDVRVETVDSATAKAERSVVSESLSSADELAQELDSLRIGKSDKPSQK